MKLKTTQLDSLFNKYISKLEQNELIIINEIILNNILNKVAVFSISDLYDYLKDLDLNLNTKTELNKLLEMIIKSESIIGIRKKIKALISQEIKDLENVSSIELRTKIKNKQKFFNNNNLLLSELIMGINSLSK